jgi:K+-transporting ATPase ATPase C chain
VLANRLSEDGAAYRGANGLDAGQAVPADAITASGSGLDPHVSVANARLQVDRVASARGATPEQILALLEQHTDGRPLGFLGESRVNVLALNLALDERYPLGR